MENKSSTCHMTSEKRLIDSNALLKRFCDLADRYIPVGNLFHLDAITYEIMDAPTVDAVEVVHGQWLTDRFGLDRSICSVCDACYEGDGGNYCPNCGAKMDGGNEDG